MKEQSASTPNLCIVLATKNEQSTIAKFSDIRNFSDVVIVIDDSSDKTPELLTNLGFFVFKGKNTGIRDAYQHGFDIAEGVIDFDYILQMDAGGSHKPENIPNMIRKAEETGADLVLAQRKFKGFAPRTLISRTAALLMGVQDATCGYRLWKKGALRQICWLDVFSTGNSFQLELLTQARQNGFKIATVEIDYDLGEGSHFKPSMLVEALWVYLKHRMWEWYNKTNYV